MTLKLSEAPGTRAARKIVPIGRARPLHEEVVDRVRDMIIEGEIEAGARLHENNLAEVLNEVLEDAGLTAADVDWVVPHQANARILDATARKLGLPGEKVVVTVDRHANTSAASVPLAFDTAVKDGRIKRGDTVVLEAMGGGFTWGAAVLRY